MDQHTQPTQGAIEIQQVGRHTWSESDLVTNYDATGIFATAQNPHGGRARDLTPETRITVRGMQMPIRAAVAAGLIRQDGEGQYREVTPEDLRADAERKTAEDQKAHKENHFEPPSGQVDAFLTDLDGAFREANIDPMTAAAAVLTGGGEEQLKAVARAEGIPLETLMDNVGHVFETYKAQADDFLSSLGLDPEAVWEFEGETVDQTRAVGGYLRHLLNGDKSYYKALADAYMKSPRFQPKLPDGVALKTSPGGRQFVEIPGYPPMSLANARRLGLT